MEVNGVAVMRRRKDSWLNATQILKVAGIEKGKRTKVLEKEILIGEHEKVQGGYGKYQGTWIMFERGLEFCRQYGVEELLRPLLTYDMGQDGGIAGRGGIDTPTKEQAMAAQRKRLYNSGAEGRSGSSGTFFKNISSTASHAVAAISKARFDSPAPRIKNGTSVTRPTSFSRQSSSQQHHGSQDSAFPQGSQQSIQSLASADSFNMNGQDSAYVTQSGPHFSQASQDSRNDFEEPPRKRMRPSPNIADSQQSLADGYYDLSLREPSPTEPNDSFIYQPTNGVGQGDEFPMPLPPLTVPPGPNGERKKDILMSLFEDPYRTDFSQHPALHELSLHELDMPVDKSSNTALHWAATLARIPLLKALIARGASIFRVNRVGESALMRAAVVINNFDNGTFPDLLEILGPIIEFRDSRGRTVLHHIAITSAIKGRSQTTKYYLESLLEFVVRQGSAPNSQQSFTNGPPALKSMGIGRFMSEIVNVQDNAGDTALNIAARIGNRSIISQLLEVGADTSITNRSNLCAVDFGIGDQTDTDGLAVGGQVGAERALVKDTRESSGDIITCKFTIATHGVVTKYGQAISTLLSDTESEFTKEMTAKQSQIDAIHVNLRDSSAACGKERGRLDAFRQHVKTIQERQHKISNLKRATEEEQARLNQIHQQYGSVVAEDDMQLGDADQGLAIPAGAVPANILSNINPNHHQPQVLDQAQRQLLASLPATNVLRARVNAYKSINDGLSENVRGLQSKSSELADKYREIISLCTNVEESNVDGFLDKLLRAVESEQEDVELARVREFLSRVDGA
jgi:regulatory protein SWI6